MEIFVYRQLRRRAIFDTRIALRFKVGVPTSYHGRKLGERQTIVCVL